MTEIEIQLVGILINSVIAIAAIGTLIYQRIYNTKTLDYNLHPVFEISDFCPQCTKYWTPKLCEASDSNSKHYCTDDHWFNLRNIGNGYAFEVNCYLLHEKEINKDFKTPNFKSRMMSRDTLAKNGNIQYKIAKDEIPFRYYNKASTESMYVVVEYRTVNSRSNFVQVIGITCTPKNSNNQISDWKNAIEISHPEVASLNKLQWWKNSENQVSSQLERSKNSDT